METKLYNEIAELEEKKYKLLKEMAKLEYSGIIDDKYKELVDSYDTVNWFLNKKIDGYDIIDKNKISSILMANNHDRLVVDGFMDMILNDNQMIVVRKIICDFGAVFVKLYDFNDEIDETGKIVNYRFKRMLSKKPLIDVKLSCDMINACLVRDFISMMFSVVEKEIKMSKEDIAKGLLVALKYNLIYLSKDLEDIAVKNKFVFPESVCLTDDSTIKKTGVGKDGYIDISNDIFGSMLEDAVYDAVDRVNDTNLSTLDYVDYIYIKTIANLITDKKICERLVLELTDQMATNIRKATEMINYDLIDSYTVNTYNRKNLII